MRSTDGRAQPTEIGAGLLDAEPSRYVGYRSAMMNMADAVPYAGLRRRLAGTGPAMIGTFVLIPRVEVVEMAAIAGFDAVVLDLEHGPYDVADLAPLLAAARASGIHALVRSADADPVRLARILDSGADGLIVPHVGTAESAASIARASRFAPIGDRSVNPYVRGLAYGLREGAMADADAGTAVLCMIEGVSGLEERVGIAETTGIDGVFIGPIDLSISLGLANPDPEDPRVVQTISTLIPELVAMGAATAIYAPNPTAAHRWAATGARLVIVSADTALLGKGLAALRQAIE
jgi:2-keto-3-deoxy-L-rhamnonate aldolase RhmA